MQNTAELVSATVVASPADCSHSDTVSNHLELDRRYLLRMYA